MPHENIQRKIPPPDGAAVDARSLDMGAERAQPDVPDGVRAAARQAFALRDTQAEVLELAADSLLSASAAGGPRRLRFGRADQRVRIDVVATAAPGGLVLQVQCDTEGVRLLEVQGDGVADAIPVTRTTGGWIVTPVPHGLVALLLRLGPTRLRTAWVRL